VSLVKQERLILPGNLSSLPVLEFVLLDLYGSVLSFLEHFCPFVLFGLAIGYLPFFDLRFLITLFRFGIYKLSVNSRAHTDLL